MLNANASRPSVQRPLVIAIDAMGGDHAPEMALAGAEKAASVYGASVHFLLYGPQDRLASALSRYPRLAAASTLHHAVDVIANDEKPSAALRRGRDSSMGLAIRAVREGKAQGVVSAGNTGALMAMAKVFLRTLPGIDRPAICGTLPTEKERIVMLDLGANSACTAENLFEFTVMGNAYARVMLGKTRPSIGLLNVGVEEVKGNEAVRSAALLIRESGLDLNFVGFVEGDDLGKGTVDVVVTDGFTGNIALKTAEGTAKFYTSLLKAALKKNLLSKLGALLAKPALLSIKDTLDPRTYNGAMFLGLNGIVVKSHGGTDDIGFANAVRVAVELAQHDINQSIIAEMVKTGHMLAEEAAGDYEEPL